jgi:hypothetical protein
MTVHASMDVGIYNVSAHGWAKDKHWTTSSVPTIFPTTIPTPNPMPSTLPIGAQTPKDNIRRLHLGEAVALAVLGETSSFYPQTPM